MDILQHQQALGSLGSSQQTPQLSLNDPVPRTGNVGSTTTAAQRKKFAKPPVKNACLSCRGSRIRCDGQQPCVNCTEKHKDCKYEKSRRGGPRVPSSRKRQETRNTSAEEEVKQESPPQPLTIEDQFLVATEFREAGAGLRLLDDIDENMGFLTAIDRFDKCGANAWDNFGVATLPDAPEDAAAFEYQGAVSWDTLNEFSVGDENVPSEVRSYESEADILDAYYVWIHAYFPVLPPPLRAPPIDRPRTRTVIGNEWVPTTPITLALSAILALIPLPDDPNARSSQSTWDRRFQAHKHAHAAFAAWDDEGEMLDSAVNPKDALSNGPSCSHRTPFHPNMPLDLEGNVTLMLLAVYEYTQRGNIKKMMNRGGQSLSLALDSQLYKAKDGNDQFAEARKRVWWATYINVCQGSIASNSPCAIDIRDPKFTIGFPTLIADPNAFPFFIQCQQAIVEATQYVIDHTAVLNQGGDLTVMYNRTVEMETRLAELSTTADAWFIYDRSPVDQPVDKTEIVVAKTLRAIARMKINSARIKIHRYSAFIDQPIFQKKHCDLIPTQPPLQHQNQHQNGNGMISSPSDSNINSSSNGSNSQFSPSNREGSMSSVNTPISGECSSCASTTGYTHTHSHPPSSRSYSSEIQPMCSLPAQAGQALVNHMLPTSGVEPRMPYNSTQSAQQCCKSAIDIAETFAMLPYPNPTGIIQSRNPVYNPADPLNPRNLTSTNYASPFGLPDMSGVGALNGGVGLSKSGGLDFSAIARQQAQHPPRTMPTFACCAMQAAYALLMGLYGVYARRQLGQLGDLPGDQTLPNGIAKPFGVRERDVREHVERLREGLGGVVAALENWAGAFEAIDGMREEVSNALEFNVVRFDEYPGSM